jgi:hypothetical protein
VKPGADKKNALATLREIAGWRPSGVCPLFAAALYYVRQRFSREIIEHIVELELMLILEGCAEHLNSTERQLTLPEISTLLSEQGESRIASAVSDKLTTHAGMSPDQQASLLRRRAHNLGLNAEHRSRVDKLLAESREIAGNYLNQLANRVNTQAFVELLEQSSPSNMLSLNLTCQSQ